jgi:hypothetical protein
MESKAKTAQRRKQRRLSNADVRDAQDWAAKHGVFIAPGLQKKAPKHRSQLTQGQQFDAAMWEGRNIDFYSGKRILSTPKQRYELASAQSAKRQREASLGLERPIHGDIRKQPRNRLEAAPKPYTENSVQTTELVGDAKRNRRLQDLEKAEAEGKITFQQMQAGKQKIAGERNAQIKGLYRAGFVDVQSTGGWAGSQIELLGDMVKHTPGGLIHAAQEVGGDLGALATLPFTPGSVIRAMVEGDPSALYEPMGGYQKLSLPGTRKLGVETAKGFWEDIKHPSVLTALDIAGIAAPVAGLAVKGAAIGRIAGVAGELGTKEALKRVGGTLLSPYKAGTVERTMSVADFAKRHGLKPDTVRKEVAAGKFGERATKNAQGKWEIKVDQHLGSAPFRFIEGPEAGPSLLGKGPTGKYAGRITTVPTSKNALVEAVRRIRGTTEANFGRALANNVRTERTLADFRKGEVAKLRATLDAERAAAAQFGVKINHEEFHNTVDSFLQGLVQGGYLPEADAPGLALAYTEEYSKAVQPHVVTLRDRLAHITDQPVEIHSIMPMKRGAIDIPDNLTPGWDLMPEGDRPPPYRPTFDVRIGKEPDSVGFTVWTNGDGTFEIPEAMDLADKDFFPDTPDGEILRGTYANALDAVRGVDKRGSVTLYRQMDPAEWKKWQAGDKIPVGKYFASDRDANLGSDISGVFPETYEITVPRSIMTEMEDGSFQLTHEAKLIDGTRLEPFDEDVKAWHDMLEQLDDGTAPDTLPLPAEEMRKMFSKPPNKWNSKDIKNFADVVNRSTTLMMLHIMPLKYIATNLPGQLWLNITAGALNPADLAKSATLYKDLHGMELTSKEMSDLYNLPEGELKEMVDRGIVGRKENGKYFIDYNPVEELRALVGGGITRSQVERGQFGGKLMAVDQKLAHLLSRILDEPFRFNTFAHYARRAGYGNTEDMVRLLKAQDPETKAYRNAIIQEANRSMIDYEALGNIEKEWVRRAILFYPWLKGSTVYFGRWLRDHPTQAAIQLQWAKTAKKKQMRELGPLPDWLQSAVKVGEEEIPGLGKVPDIIDPTAASIVTQAPDLATSLLNTTIGQKPTIGEHTSPLIQAGGALLGWDVSRGRELGGNIFERLGQTQLAQSPVPSVVQDLMAPRNLESIFPRSHEQRLLQTAVGGRVFVPQPMNPKKSKEYYRRGVLEQLPTEGREKAKIAFAKADYLSAARKKGIPLNNDDGRELMKVFNRLEKRNVNRIGKKGKDAVMADVDTAIQLGFLKPSERGEWAAAIAATPTSKLSNLSSTFTEMFGQGLLSQYAKVLGIKTAPKTRPAEG